MVPALVTLGVLLLVGTALDDRKGRAVTVYVVGRRVTRYETTVVEAASLVLVFGAELFDGWSRLAQR